MRTMAWDKAREGVLFAYGNDYDGDPSDDPCFYCPHCGEPIYEEDFPNIEINENDLAICPVCEEEYA